MASNSKETDHMSTCLVCFETRSLKIVGNCKHSFCTECLSAVLESLEGGSEVFACPSCKVDCPRPSDGVMGLVDFTGEDVSAAAVDIPRPEPDQEGSASVRELTVTGTDTTVDMADIKCQNCVYHRKDVPAANLCVACGNLHICGDCTELHAKNKATEKHLIVPLKIQGRHCKTHDHAVHSYCKDCKEAVCMICVLQAHGNHLVERLEDTICYKVEDVKGVLRAQEKKLTELQDLKEDLTLLTTLAPLVDKQDILIKEIEDHAQKCINQIVKWKEDLKTKVKADFKVISDVPTGFKKVTKVVEKLEEVVSRAFKLLGETEHHPVYLDKLVALQQELESIDGIGDDVEGKEFRSKLKELHRSNNTFSPEILPTMFGKLYKSSTFEPKEIFKHRIQVVSNDVFIPCVANLGKKFAVAHPTKKGEPSNAIDIYEFPGTLIKTLRDHVPPIYDMSATPDGKLAVLSDGTVDSSCSVQVFEPDTGFISSTCDVDAAKPIAIGVTLQNQFVILGDNEQGQTQITVADKDGVVQHRLVLNQGSEKVKNPNRITCGGRFIFIKGDKTVSVLEIKGTGLQAIKTDCINIQQYCTDISATVWDDFFVTNILYNNLDLDCKHHEENTLKLYHNGYKRIHKNVTRADREASVSTRDGHIVMSHGQTVRVYKL